MNQHNDNQDNYDPDEHEHADGHHEEWIRLGGGAFMIYHTLPGGSVFSSNGVHAAWREAALSHGQVLPLTGRSLPLQPPAAPCSPLPTRSQPLRFSGTECALLIVHRGPVTVAANLGTRTWTFTPAGRRRCSSPPTSASNRRAGVVLPPDTVAILTRQVCHDTCLGVSHPTFATRPGAAG